MKKLLNLDEEIPSEFFIFVSETNFITQHNFKLSGQFTSGAYTSVSFSEDVRIKYLAGTLRYLADSNGAQDSMGVSPFYETARLDPLEHQIEAHRHKFHPLYPSRLSAIYAFGDYESCRKASEKYKWPLSEVRRFCLIHDDFYGRVIKVNMERISLARMPWSGPPAVEGSVYWEEYWQGKGNTVWMLPPGSAKEHQESGVIWEYLIEGAVKCVD